MLSIQAGDFLLQMHPVSTRREGSGGPYLAWIDVQINLMVPGIRAEGRWSVMPDELRRFQQQVQSMQAQMRAGQRAELTGVEAGFELRLKSLERGAIVGDWRFQPSPPDGANMTGCCGLDQSFLPELLLGIESLLTFADAKVSP